ncbi:MAG: RasGEF domain-containing protein, partial [archaeon]|nr:RasGEF domain-containing protein [archaeon]
IDSILFHAITVPEFFQGNWQQDKDPSLAPNIVALTQRFNQVSFWITSEILSTPTPERRLYNMIFFLDVAHTCLEHRSFHTAMAILAALTNSAVQRIKSLWAALPPEKKEIFDELSDTLSNEQNFKRYRRVLKTASGSVLPFMGVFLQDVTFALQNSPETPSGLINWQRYSVLGSIFIDLIQYQRALRFPFAKIPELSSYLKRVEGLKQEQLFIMSRFLQGRASRASPPPSSSSSSSSSSQSSASRLRHQALSASAPVPVVSPISLGNSEPVSPIRTESLTPPASGRRFSIFQFKRAGSKDSELNPDS